MSCNADPILGAAVRMDMLHRTRVQYMLNKFGCYIGEGFTSLDGSDVNFKGSDGSGLKKVCCDVEDVLGRRFRLFLEARFDDERQGIT